MKTTLFALFLLSCITCGAQVRNKKVFTVKQHKLSLGFQYGIGKVFDKNTMINTGATYPQMAPQLSYSHNFNLYAKYKIKFVRASAGLRISDINFGRNSFREHVNAYYAKPGFDITYNKFSNMAEVITPFIGVGYVFPVRRFELEPFMRFGLGVLNYRLLNIDYESNNSSALNETVYFSDKKPVVFFNPNIGLDSRTKMSNLFSLTAALAFDYGKAPKNEILEKTSKNSNIIGMRNIYMQSNVHNFYFSLGIEVTFFNKIYAGEKNNYGAKK